jgi:hypothetical protein
MYAGPSAQFHRVTTVVTAASSVALTSLLAVKQELDLVDTDANRDAVLTRYVAACSAAIQAYCNRIFAVQTLQDQFFPQRDAPITPLIQGQDPLQLSNYPIVSLTSVVENPASTTPYTLTSGADFLEDDDEGQLIRLDKRGYPKRWSPLAVTVVYEAGYATLPVDVVDACIDFVKWRYFARMRDPGIRQENIPNVYEASYLWGTGPGGPDDIPATVSEKIARYRVPVIG